MARIRPAELEGWPAASSDFEGLCAGTAVTVNGLVAVLTGMLAPLAFAKLGKDPAIGSGEITTALSDNVSMLTYLIVATLVLF